MSDDGLTLDWLLGPVDSVPTMEKPRAAQTAGAVAQGGIDSPCAADLTAPPPLEAALLTLAQARAILADPMRDMAYLDTRLGPTVAAYIAWKKLGRPAKTTIDTYERRLARLAVSLPAGVGIAELDVADLSLYLNTVPPDSWRHDRTIIKGFIEWAIMHDHRSAKNPILLLPKMQPGPQRTVKVFTESDLDALINAARFMDDPVRDQARAILLIDSGFRKAECRTLRHREIDPGKKTVTVIGKGDKEREIPIAGDFWLAYERSLFEPIPRLGRLPEPNDFFWFPMRVAGAYQSRERQVTKAYPDVPMSPRAFHKWWERLVDHAGIDLPETPHHPAHLRDRGARGLRRHLRRQGAPRACVRQDDRAVPARREEEEGIGRPAAR